MAEYAPIPEENNRIGRAVYDAAFEVHRALGPGLLESVYRACLAEELVRRGFCIRLEVPVPVIYKDSKLPVGFRIDMLVDESVVVEAKAIEVLHPVHEAQLLTYLKLSGYRLGYLINFNVVLLKDGIRRFVV